MQSEPLVSILVNNYNYARFLRCALDSALAQTYPRVEVVVVDDGSTDGSREIIAGYGARVVAVLKENGGQASAFNAGFAACTGEIVCLLDADDAFHPRKVEHVVRVFRSAPEAGWFFHELRLVRSDGELAAADEPVTPPAAVARDVSAQVSRGRPPFVPPATSALCFTRELLGRILPMAEAIRITSDNYVKWTAMVLSPGVHDPAPLATQRLHGDNAYTLRPGPERVRLGLLVAAQSALAMLQQTPQMRRFARGLVIDTLAASRAPGRASPEASRLLDAALAHFNRAERLEIRARGWLRFVRKYRGTGEAAPDDAAAVRA